MAKSTNGTKKLNEALTPDQVSKVEDKYKSIYSGMLKGNKKKLMKYIDPKLKRPNPDAMAMGRAINLVKKETETETVNEAADPKVLSAIETLKKVKAGPKRKEAMSIVLDAAYKKTGEKARTYKQALQFLDLEEPINEQMDIYDDIANSEFGMDYDQLGPNEQEWVRDEIDNMELREEKDKATWQYTLLNKGDKTVTIKADDMESANSQILKTYPNSDPMLTHKNGKEINWNSKPMRRMRKTVNETLKLGVKYQLPTGETGYISTKGSTYPSQWEFTGTGEKYLDVEDKLTPLEKQPGKYDGAFDMGHGKGHHIDEESLNEDNSYDSFKTDESERFLNRSQVVELLPVLKNSLNKLNFSPSKQPTLSVKRYGLSSSNKGYVISMYIPTSKDDIIVELGKYPKDDKTDEVSISLYLPNEEGRLTQVAYETSTSPKGEELAEDSNVLSKVISMANQWYEKPNTIDERLATLVKEVYSEKQRKWACAQDGPEFEEMCKDTAISKKKLKEEMTSTVSKARAKSELKQMLKGKRDDGMGKSTLKAVLAIDKDGKETKVKKLEDFDKFEKGTKFSLKETTMKNDRLTELIKAALTGPVKEGGPGGIDDDFFKDEDREERLKKREEEEMEKSTKSATKGLDDEAMMESSTLKEGVWSRGTATQIRDFLRDLNSLKDKYYSIVGSDDVFDGLNRAERAAEEMAYDAGRSIKEITELATTPIKDDIYAIGSRIYKDPYEAISLVATDQTVVVRDFARKDKKFKAAVMDYVKSKGLETSVDRDGLYIDTKPLDFKGIPLMNEKKQRPDYPDIDGDGDTKEPMAKAAKDKKSMVESIFKKLRG